MYCKVCGAVVPDKSNFCPECGEKIQNKNNKFSDSDIFMEIHGGSGQFRRYRLYLKRDGVVIGKGGIIDNQFSYTNLDYDEVEDISIKKIGFGTETENDMVNITIKTIYWKIEAKGFRIGSAKAFAETLQRILDGDKEIFYKTLTEIKTDDIPIFAGNTNKKYINLGKVSVRADSSLFSKTTTMNDANARLREEAVKLGANAIINANYERTSMTSWIGMQAEGTAVYIESDLKKCPYCAEMIKKEAIKCKHCHSDLK